MPLTIGSVVFVALIVWLLGEGDTERGVARFMLLQWSLLGIVLLFMAITLFHELFLVH